MTVRFGSIHEVGLVVVGAACLTLLLSACAADSLISPNRLRASNCGEMSLVQAVAQGRIKAAPSALLDCGCEGGSNSLSPTAGNPLSVAPWTNQIGAPSTARFECDPEEDDPCYVNIGNYGMYDFAEEDIYMVCRGILDVASYGCPELADDMMDDLFTGGEFSSYSPATAQEMFTLGGFPAINAPGAHDPGTDQTFIGIESTLHTSEEMWLTLRHEYAHMMEPGWTEQQAEEWAQSGSCTI